MRTCTIAVILLLGMTVAPAASAAASDERADTCGIEKLAWLSGSWELVTERSRTEEHWTELAAGTMLGVGRTIAGGKTVFYEYLRVEARTDGVYYVALIKGQPEVAFKLVRCEGEAVVFENPAHDFPQRIICRKNKDGSLHARIEGPRQGKTVGEDFPYKRMNRD